MEKCEMIEKGKAYRIFLSKQIAEQMTKLTREKYNEGDEVILCGLKEDECPYKNQEEGILISYMDEDDVFSICKSKGLINKLQLK